jgi:tetratricopeptide (TPR) repeat protein
MSHLRFTVCDLRFQPRQLGCFIVLAMLICGGNSARAATNDFFAQGMKLSRAGQFPEAAAAFEKSARAQPASGTLVNLGIAEWRRGRAGGAILAWEQARWIDPFDARAGADLKFARQVAQVDEPQLKWFETASTWLPPDAWVWLAGASLWLALGLLVLPGIFRRRQAGWQQVLAALAFGVFMFCLTANFGVLSRTHIGFVVAKNAPLLLTPTRDGETIATLAAGEPARELRTRGNYSLIRTAGVSGWVERNEFRRICPQ